MTDKPAKSWYRFVPQLSSRWWTALLGLSLMANLLIAGLVLGTRYRGDDRIMGASAVQVFRAVSCATCRVIAAMNSWASYAVTCAVCATCAKAHLNKSSNSLMPWKTTQATSRSFARRLQPMQPARQPRRQNRNFGHRRHRKMTPEERKSLAAAIRERASRVKERKKN